MALTSRMPLPPTLRGNRPCPLNLSLKGWEGLDKLALAPKELMETPIFTERKDQIHRKGEAPFEMECNKESLAGAVSQRACVFCGSRVVLYPIADALHLVHGPIGCAAYTWDIRGALVLGAGTAPPELLHGPPGDGRHFRRRRQAGAGPERTHRPASPQGRVRLLHLHRGHHRRRPGKGLQEGGEGKGHPGAPGAVRGL